MSNLADLFYIKERPREKVKSGMSIGFCRLGNLSTSYGYFQSICVVFFWERAIFVLQGL